MNQKKPAYVINLEKVYGPPSQEAFGPAVFFEISKNLDLEKYRYFAGEFWEEWGEEAWMGPWKQVYTREKGQKGDILQELENIDDFDAKMSVPLLLEGIEDSEQAHLALQEAFDDPGVTELAVFNVGDGGAVSGILIAAFRENSNQATWLIFMMD